MKLNIGLFGSTGRMGKEILALANQDPSILLTSLDIRKKSEILKGIDVALEFTCPQGALNVATWCSKEKIPLVSGVTGFSPEEETQFRKASQIIPLFWSPNLSVGLNAMALAMVKFSHHFPSKKVTIEDVHHINKKDKPSGTAKFLHGLVKENVGTETQVFDPVSIREAEVFGTHTINFFSTGEIVSFRHEALNRGIFAEGALQAARWVSRIGVPGFYQMKDLLNE